MKGHLKKTIDDGRLIATAVRLLFRPSYWPRQGRLLPFLLLFASFSFFFDLFAGVNLFRTVLLRISEWILKGFTGFYWVLQGFIGFLGFNGFSSATLSLGGFHWVPHCYYGF